MARRPPSKSPNRGIDPMQEARAIRSHPLDWIFEPLENHPGFLRKKIFGCEAAYISGKLRLVIAVGEEPWNGLMVATAREFHDSLRGEWSQLQPHSVLGKWLYLSQDNPQFETVATAIAKRIREGDPRIGVEPRPRKRRKKRAPKPPAQTDNPSR